MNNAGVKNKRVLGFVDLGPRQYTSQTNALPGGPQNRILDAITVLIEQGLEPRQERLNLILWNLVWPSSHIFHNTRIDDFLFPGK